MLLWFHRNLHVIDFYVRVWSTLRASLCLLDSCAFVFLPALMKANRRMFVEVLKCLGRKGHSFHLLWKVKNAWHIFLWTLKSRWMVVWVLFVFGSPGLDNGKVNSLSLNCRKSIFFFGVVCFYLMQGVTPPKRFSSRRYKFWISSVSNVWNLKQEV